MTLFIQNPTAEDTTYLIEALAEACSSAEEGAGAFAFASPTGVEMFLRDDSFTGFAKKHRFLLIVGVDAVTNTAALNAISKSAKKLKGVTVKAFVHNQPNALFHPKCCWFRTADGGRLITGSGNLTSGGLRSNWEAFAVEEHKKISFRTIIDHWNKWITRHSSNLYDINHPDVMNKVKDNDGWVFHGGGGKRRSGVRRKEKATRESVEPAVGSQEVLIAEIPRSGDRWNQANFDLETYEDFFGAKRGTQRRVFLQHVLASGVLQPIETRPSVAVRSQNYRFELEAAAGKAYPSDGRPIGVFVKVATRTFRYRLLFPRNPGYGIVNRFLAKQWKGPSRRVRRVRVQANELLDVWPNSPLWKDGSDSK